VGPRAGLDKEAIGKILSPLPGIEPLSPGSPARNQTLYCLSYTDSTDTDRHGIYIIEETERKSGRKENQERKREKRKR
jgi:hypothetical protein